MARNVVTAIAVRLTTQRAPEFVSGSSACWTTKASTVRPMQASETARTPRRSQNVIDMITTATYSTAIAISIATNASTTKMAPAKTAAMTGSRDVDGAGHDAPDWPAGATSDFGGSPVIPSAPVSAP